MQEIFISELKEKVEKAKRVCVFGGGSTGSALIRFFQKRNINSILIDKNPMKLEFPAFTDSVDLKDLPEFEFLIKSPGISPDHKLLHECREKKIPILSEISLARLYFEGKILGITGTDGKSTTTALTHHILSNTELKTAMGGNIGIPFIDFCEEKLDLVVLELSSYQLEDSLPLHLSASAYLNLANDHLERHKTLENYHKAKCKIASFDREEHIFVVNEKLLSRLDLNEIKCKVYPFGRSKESSARINVEKNYIQTNSFEYSLEKFPLFGEHNIENLSASILLCEAFGCKPEEIENSYSNFNGLNYRFQQVHTHRNAIFINDSKSTNLHSMLSGIKGFVRSDSLVFILGGRPKQESIQPLIDRMKELSPKCIYIYGEAREIWSEANKIENVVRVTDPIQALENLKSKWESLDPEYIIFSPACASFDIYKNFEERGKIFTEAVRSIF